MRHRVGARPSWRRTCNVSAAGVAGAAPDASDEMAMVVAPIRAARARGRRRCPRAREGVRCGGLMQYEPLWSAPSGFQACDGIPFTPVPKLAQREIRGSLEIKLFFRSRTSAAKVPFCFGSERQRHRPRSLDADTAPRPHNGERHRHAPRARSPHGLSCSDPTRLCTRAHARPPPSPARGAVAAGRRGRLALLRAALLCCSGRSPPACRASGCCAPPLQQLLLHDHHHHCVLRESPRSLPAPMLLLLPRRPSDSFAWVRRFEAPRAIQLNDYSGINLYTIV